ncbi:FHA domain protein [Lachnospiraceae bacterium YSD2013]|nr:FHA domain protein [Lachnospiraceae bacterium YSD2013]
MNITYENNTLTVKETEGRELDTMSLGMLINNDIEGVAKVSFSKIDEIKIFTYSLEGYEPLKNSLKGTVKLSGFLEVIKNLTEAVIGAKNYMLEESMFLYDFDYVFINPKTKKVSLICVPLDGEAVPGNNLFESIKTTLFSSQFDYSGANDVFGQVINFLNGTDALTIEALNNILKNAKPDSQVNRPVSAPTPAPAPAPAQKPQAQKPQPVAPMMDSKPAGNGSAGMAIPTPAAPAVPDNAKANKAEEKGKGLFGLFGKKEEKPKKEKAPKEKPEKKADKKKEDKKKPAPQKSRSGFAIPGQEISINDAVKKEAEESASEAVTATPVETQNVMSNIAKPVVTAAGNFGETTVLSPSTLGETSVLDSSLLTGASSYTLIRIKNGERINSAKEQFVIGKEKSCVDYFISDNPAISRTHAVITSTGGRYFVKDKNSTNHTFVNGKLIASETDKEIFSGDRIRLANEEFEFIVM